MRTDFGSNRLSFRLAFRPFADMFQFHGRSTRTEVISFWLLGIVSGTIRFSGDVLSLDPIFVALGVAWALLWQWPWVALLVRRLHDQGRSGYWALILALVPAVFGAFSLLPKGILPSGYTHIVNWGEVVTIKSVDWTVLNVTLIVVAIGSGLATLALYMWVPSADADRYGPDPRLDSAAPLVPAET